MDPSFEPTPVPVIAPTDPAPNNERRLMAPVWHTVALILVLLAFSYLGAVAGHPTQKQAGRVAQYVVTIAWEWLLFGYVVWGFHMRGTKLRDVIGGRWERVEDFLMDFVLAIGFWIVSAMVLAGVGWAVGMTHPNKVEEARKSLEFMIPQTNRETAVAVLLALTAGFVEEVIFRGYLQRQFSMLAKSDVAGIIIAALAFGAAHGYEGWQRMVMIAVFGAMFGLLVHWRKSLRPGMMTHAMHDSMAMIALRFVKNLQ